MHRKQALAYAAAAVMVGGTLVGATTALAGPDTITVSAPEPAAETTTEVEATAEATGFLDPAATESAAPDAATAYPADGNADEPDEPGEPEDDETEHEDPDEDEKNEADEQDESEED